MPTEPAPVTVAAVVHAAVAAVDGTGVDADLGRLLERFEDADQPIGDPELVRIDVADAIKDLDLDGDDGALQTAGAIATYLAFRRDELDEDPGELMRLAVRAEYHDAPPAPVADFLTRAGIA